MSQTCDYCGQRAQTGVLICSACEKQTRRHLGSMPAWEEELLQGGVSSPGDERSLPFDPAASEVRATARNILVGWSRITMEQCPEIHGATCRACGHRSCNEIKASRWPEDEIGSMARYLEGHMHTLRRHEAAGEMVAEINQLVRDILRVIDHTPDRSRIPLGRQCPEEDDGGVCAGQLWMCVPWKGEGRQRVECQQCGQVWHAERFLRLGKQLGTPMHAAGATRLARALST